MGCGLVAERVGGQPRVGHRAGVGAVGDLRAHLGQRGGVQLTGDLVEASTCRSVSSLRRYSGTTFSARINDVRSASTTTSAGMSGAAVVVHAALT